jgi:AmiR/NasT family two-component response regulator
LTIEASRDRSDGKKFASIRGLSVLVCCAPDNSVDDCIRELQRNRVDVRHMWPIPQRLSDGMDILICDYLPNLTQALPWTPGEPGAALVVVLPQNGHYDDDEVAALTPQAVVQRPMQPTLLRTSTVVAWSQFRYEQRLRARVARLDENMRTIRDIERAKTILMTDKRFDEDGAYKYLRDLAMERRISVAALASDIVEQAQGPL